MCLGAIGVITELGESGSLPTAVVDLGDRRIDAAVLDITELRVGAHVIIHSGIVVQVLGDDLAAEMLAARAEVRDGD